jgi:PKD repeat protein
MSGISEIHQVLSDEEHPVHKYDKMGQYEVSLVTFNELTVPTQHRQLFQ